MTRLKTGLATAIALATATPTFADTETVSRFDVSSHDIHEMLIRIGCNPMPERLKWEYGVPREEQPYTDAERDKRSSEVWHCMQYDTLKAAQSPDIYESLQNDPQDAILALRALSDDQKVRSNPIARAAAVEMARYALDYAYADRLGNHRDLPQFYNELKSLLDQIPTEPVSFYAAELAQPRGSAAQSFNPHAAMNDAKDNYDAMEAAHTRAYAIRLELEHRGFKPSYVHAAQAVAMAASVGNPYQGYTTERDWAALFGAYDAMDSTILFKDSPHDRESRIASQEHAKKVARDVLMPALTKERCVPSVQFSCI